jgi:cytochrome c biogenesis protein CcdA
MGIQKRRMFCEEEIAMVLAERQTPNHVLHLLLSIFTAGFWIPVWIVVAIFTSGAYRCPRCGAKTRSYVPKKYKAALAAKSIPST